MKKRETSNDKGMALIIAVIFLAVMGLLATIAMMRVSNHTLNVTRYTFQQNMDLGLMSAYELTNLSDDDDLNIPVAFDFTLGANDSLQSKMTDAMEEYFTANDNPLASNPNVQFAARKEYLDNVGGIYEQETTYAVAGYVHNGEYAVSGMVVRVERTDFGAGSGSDDSVWDTAVFAGGGQGGGKINGNVSIHGSVHILGDNTNIGDLVMDFGGNSGIYNNYDGIPEDTLEDNFSANPDTNGLDNGLVDDNGEESIEATLRVKNGQVRLWGSGILGEESADAGSKDYLDGVFVNNDWYDGDRTPGGIPNDGIVNSDNGYDLDYSDFSGNDDITFPLFSDVINEDTDQIYFDSNDPTSYYLEGQTPYIGDITIEAGDPNTSFYYNSSTGDGTAVIGESPGNPGMPTQEQVEQLADSVTGPGEFVIWYDGATDTLFVNGRVAVEGDFEILSGTGGNDTINYSGQGSVLAYADDNGDGGNVLLETNLYTTDFPLGNVLGVMAEFDLDLGGGSQKELMGGFYAQETVSMDKQTILAGTIVGANFDMGNQVPSIFQVPLLLGAWSTAMHMIGDNPDGGGNPPGNTEGNIFFEFGVAL